MKNLFNLLKRKKIICDFCKGEAKKQSGNQGLAEWELELWNNFIL